MSDDDNQLLPPPQPLSTGAIVAISVFAGIFLLIVILSIVFGVRRGWGVGPRLRGGFGRGFGRRGSFGRGFGRRGGVNVIL